MNYDAYYDNDSDSIYLELKVFSQLPSTDENTCTHDPTYNGDWGVVAACKRFKWRYPECMSKVEAVTTGYCVFNPRVTGVVNAGTEWYHGDHVPEQAYDRTDYWIWQDDEDVSQNTCEDLCDKTEFQNECAGYIW